MPGTARPHVILITRHDLGRLGAETVRSTNPDGLAARGVRFEQAYYTSHE